MLLIGIILFISLLAVIDVYRNGMTDAEVDNYKHWKRCNDAAIQGGKRC